MKMASEMRKPTSELDGREKRVRAESGAGGRGLLWKVAQNA